jgi:hypothetical protein
MASLPLILLFFGGLILLFVLGNLISHLFNLDQYYEDVNPRENTDVHLIKSSNPL